MSGFLDTHKLHQFRLTDLTDNCVCWVLEHHEEKKKKLAASLAAKWHVDLQKAKAKGCAFIRASSQSVKVCVFILCSIRASQVD